MRLLFSALAVSLIGVLGLNADPYPANLHERVVERSKAVVALEFVVEREIDRQQGFAYGLVVDDQGTIVVLESMIPSWIPVEKLKNFVGYSIPYDDEEYDLKYLGNDYPSGWHVLAFEEGLPEAFTPITSFDRAVADMGEPVFGVGAVGKDMGFDPFVLTARVALTKRMPDRQVIMRDDIANPGCPIFNVDGAFVAWATDPQSYRRTMNVGRETLTVTSEQSGGNVHWTQQRRLSIAYLEGIDPVQVEGPRPWIGVSGMQPIDPDVAEFLGIKNQSGIVLSEILDESPSSRAGLENNDILITVDGEILPRFRPDYSVTPYFQKLIRQKAPGQKMTVEVIRGEETKVLRCCCR